jgi:signal transduction histidine kinase
MAKKKIHKPKQDTQHTLEESQQGLLREFYKRVLIMQEEENRRISRDLHDETGQAVIALGASLNVIEKELKEGHIQKALTLINENRKLIQEIANKMKSMALNLRPPALDILGLPAVLREYFSQCTTSNPVRIEFNENIKDTKLNSNIEITLYRIVQEAIYNILKHSMAMKVKVDFIVAEKKLKLIIEDNGKGFDVKGYKEQFDVSKMGLRGIKERVDILNGAFFVESSPGKGTRLTVTLPLTEEITHAD